MLKKLVLLIKEIREAGKRSKTGRCIVTYSFDSKELKVNEWLGEKESESESELRDRFWRRG